MNWKLLRLGDIAVEDRQIIAPDSSEVTMRPYLGLEQIEAGTGRILSYDGNLAEGKSTAFAFDESHILYGKLRPYLNKVAMPERMGRCSTEIIPLLPKGVDREFLAFLLRTDAVVNAVMSKKTGSRMPRADMNVLFGLEISIPETFGQQRQIAARLKAQLAEVETARQAVRAQLGEIDALRAAIYRDAFGQVMSEGIDCDYCPPPRHSSCQWLRLGDMAQTTSGSTPSRGDKRYWLPAEIPWVKTGEVAFAPITKTEEAISRRALAECSLTLLPPETVLIAMYGQGKTRGQSAILKVEATTNQACFAILPNNTWDTDFIHHWLMASYEDLRGLSEGRGGNQANLNGALLNDLKIPAPEMHEQRDIAARLKAQLAETDVLRTALSKQQRELDALPQSILAQAFIPPPSFCA